MTKLGNDFRQALRVAAHQKSVTVMAIVAFALGIGVTTAVFSIFNGVLLAPLPFPDPDAAGARLRHAAGLRHLPGVVPEVSRLEDAQPGLLRDRRLDQASFVLTGQRRARAGHRRRRRPRRSTTYSACGRCSAAGTRRTRTSPAARRSSSSPTVLDSGSSAAIRSDRRPDADLRRRAVRSDRRDAGDASPIAAPTSSCRCSASSIRRRAAAISCRPTRG